MFGFIRRWRERREAEYRARLASLLRQYPHDHPWVVEALLADRRVAACAARTLSEAHEKRQSDARVREMVREELTKCVRENRMDVRAFLKDRVQ